MKLDTVVLGDDRPVDGGAGSWDMGWAGCPGGMLGKEPGGQKHWQTQSSDTAAVLLGGLADIIMVGGAIADIVVVGGVGGRVN
jgi:hypothetical protein